MSTEYAKIQLSGGLSHTEPANERIQQICDKVKPQAEKKAGIKYGRFAAVSFTSQVVAGSLLFIKVDVGGNKYVHLRVHQQLPCNGGALDLTGIQQSKSQQDPIESF